MEQQFPPRATLYEQIIASLCEEAGMASRARQLLECVEVMFPIRRKKERLSTSGSLFNMVSQASEDQLETAAAGMVRTKRDETIDNIILLRKR